MSPKNCADCNSRDRELGSRCWNCYIHWSGRKYGVAKCRWWKERFDIMQATFYGRYFMISCGQSQDDIWRTFHFIWPHRKGVVRPDWLRRDTKYRAAMLRIVANIERYARRKYEASGGSEEV